MLYSTVKNEGKNDALLADKGPPVEKIIWGPGDCRRHY